MSEYSEKIRQSRVAVIGSGLAGLTAAYLLQNDPRQRYDVTVFESGTDVSLDSASVTIDPYDDKDEPSRIDVPMRAFTAGYYRNLIAMYKHLGVSYHWRKFLFEFVDCEAQSEKDKPDPYFIHASDYHKFPPPRPRAKHLLDHSMELVFVIVCFFWFMACCHLVPVGNDGESLDDYLRRIWLPRRFVTRYLLPLLSAVATCSHEELLAFPASDIVRYRKQITGRKQFVVAGGVSSVEQLLTQNLELRLREKVTRIEPKNSGLEVVSEAVDGDRKTSETIQIFDRVITAVSPDVVAAMFEPARSQLARIPVRNVETLVYRVPTDESLSSSTSGADRIRLKTSNVDGGWTEAMHLRPGGIAAISCPLSASPMSQTVVSRTSFTRTLRTVESRRIVQQMLGASNGVGDSKFWRNGDHGVWLVGAWCFDGMVLLEGAVTSAMHVAREFDIEIPWESRAESMPSGAGKLSL